MQLRDAGTAQAAYVHESAAPKHELAFGGEDEEEVLQELLTAGGTLLRYRSEGSSSDDTEESWASSTEVARSGSQACRCLFLVGTRRDFGRRGSVVLMAPLTEAVDAAAASTGLGLIRPLRPGPADLCRQALRREPQHLTPLAACVPDSGARVAISAALQSAGAPAHVTWRLSDIAAVACPLGALLTVLRARGVQVDEGVPCTSTALAAWQFSRALVSKPANSVALDTYNGEAHWVTEQDDTRLEVFRNLVESKYETDIIAESPEVIRMLLASDFEVSKLLVKPSLFSTLRDSLEARAERRGEAPVASFLCEPALMERITGVPAKHASAALAAADRPPLPTAVAQAIPQALDLDAPLRILALDEGLDEEAVGALIRDAAAFGVHAVLLERGCGDPFHRRAARVAMGHVFRVPILRGSLSELLQELGTHRGVLTVGAVASNEVGLATEASRAAAGGDSPDVADRRQPCFLDELPRGSVPNRWVCAVGPGGPVASAELRDVCQLRVAVRAALPECPLGVGVVASILLNGLGERVSGVAGAASNVS